MSFFKTKGLNVYIEDAEKVKTADVITAVTNAAPAVVTPTTIGNFANTDVVLIQGTGFTSLDGKYFQVANIDASTFELKGSDASAEAAPGNTGTATPYSLTDDMLKICFETMGTDEPAAPVIVFSTFCGTEQESGEPEPGTWTWTGWQDWCDPAQIELDEAKVDGNERLMGIENPKGEGWIFASVVVNQYSTTYPDQGGAAFSGGGVLKERAQTLRYCS